MIPFSDMIIVREKKEGLDAAASRTNLPTRMSCPPSAQVHACNVRQFELYLACDACMHWSNYVIPGRVCLTYARTRGVLSNQAVPIDTCVRQSES